LMIMTGIATNYLYGISKTAIHETYSEPVRFNEIQLGLRVENDKIFEEQIETG
ncbi:6221_t:CDS:1, partial [Ambispora leptoticha]